MRQCLKFWRIERGLSQHELADLTSIPRHVIQEAETGVKGLTVEQASTIASLLKAPIDDFSGHIDQGGGT